MNTICRESTLEPWTCECSLLCGESVLLAVASLISKRLYRHISQEVCPWNVKFSQELAVGSPFAAREFIAGKDAVTLARDILALDQERFSAAFRKSPMKRAKLRGLQRNAAVVLGNAGGAAHMDSLARTSDEADPSAREHATEELARLPLETAACRAPRSTTSSPVP